MIVGIDHTQITVPKGSETSAKEFYCSFLGLKEIEKQENRKKNGDFWLQVGSVQIHLGVDRNLTKAHFAYRVDHLDLWRKKCLDPIP